MFRRDRAYIIYILRKEKGKESKAGQSKQEKAAPLKKFYRTSDDKVLGGVCGGIAHYFNIDPTLIRIGFAVFAFITDLFLWIIVYVILVFILPQGSVKKMVSKSE